MQQTLEWIRHSTTISKMKTYLATFISWTSLTLAFHLHGVITETDDDRFVHAYGNDFYTSGTWDTLRNICRNNTKDGSRVENICRQAHIKTGKNPGTVGLALCFTRKLMFRDLKKYRPIKIDLIFYFIEELMKPDGLPYYFYISKGLKPNCVYYLEPIGNDTSTLTLGQHVCGITM